MKQKEIDTLSRDAMAAEAAGMSYGKFKGLQYERVKNGMAPLPYPQAVQAAGAMPKYCVVCGEAFYPKHKSRKYCSADCNKYASRARWSAQRAKEKEARK